jgi:uncharacterized protein (DUF983 family)
VTPDDPQPAPEASPASGWRLLFLRRALRKRCPQCGQGSIFRAYARVADSCAECGLVFRREQGAQTGSMYVSAAVTEVFAALVILVVVALTDWSTTVRIAVGVPLVLVFCYLFLPYSQSLWVAVEYGTDVHNGEDWARPRRRGGA